MPSVAKHESTAWAGLLRATLRWGWAAMLAIHSSMTPNAIGVWSNASAGRASVNQTTWLDASPSALSMRWRAAKDCWVLCMSSWSSR